MFVYLLFLGVAAATTAATTAAANRSQMTTAATTAAATTAAATMVSKRMSGSSMSPKSTMVSQQMSGSSMRPKPPACLKHMDLMRIKRCAMLLKHRGPMKICRNFSSFRCVNGTSMRHPNTTWCPSCLSPQMLVSNCRQKVPTCTNVKPMVVLKDTQFGWSLCPSCRPLDAPAPSCTPAQVKACYTKMNGDVAQRPPACSAGERPVKDGCCVSCLPATVSCFPNTDPRTFKASAQVKTCIAKQKTNPVCANGTRPAIVNCCRSCTPLGADRPVDAAGKKLKCTRANFQKALENAPECELNERPLNEKDQKSCAPSCRRPSSSFKLAEVVSCLTSLPLCANGSRPEFIPGERCPTCKPRKPVCAGCTAKQVCVKKQVGGQWKPTCVRKGFLKMRLTLKDASFRTKIKALAKAADAVEIFKEILARFCERPSEVDRCAMFKDRLDESMDVTEKTDVAGSTDKVDFTITTSFDSAKPTATGGRRLLQANDPTALLKDAVADSDPNVLSVDSSSNGVDNGQSTKSSGSKLVSGFIAFLSMAVYLVVN